jgi:hypothetical protein
MGAARDAAICKGGGVNRRLIFAQAVVAKAAEVFGVPRLKIGLPTYEKPMAAAVYGLWVSGMDVVTISETLRVDASEMLRLANASMKESRAFAEKAHDVFWFAHHQWREVA